MTKKIFTFILILVAALSFTVANAQTCNYCSQCPSGYYSCILHHCVHTSGYRCGRRVVFANLDASNESENNIISLHSNYNVDSTTAFFFVEEPGKVSLKIYDMTGRLVKTLANNSFEEGEHSVAWNLKDENDHSLTPGIYSLIMNTRENSETEKLIVMK